MTNNTITNQLNAEKTKAAGFEDVQIFGAEQLCGFEKEAGILGNCAIFGFFVALSAVAIYVMVAFPQSGM